MAATFLIGLLLIASGAIAAAGDDGASEVPHLQLPVPGTLDAGRGHGSDAPPSPQGLMDIMYMSGCGRFAALVAEIPTVKHIFQQRLLVAGGVGGGGLTLFCPDDRAVAAFEATFRNITDSDPVNVLLHHGAAARYVRAQIAGFGWVAVPTLAAADAATNETQTVLVRDRGETIRLWPTWPRDGVATVTKTVSSSETPLVLYVVDAVLLRQKLDGGDEAAACGGQGGGYFGWLYCCISVWAVLCWVVAAIVGFLSGWFVGSMAGKLQIKDAVMRIMH